jgi:hypothetical protein
MTIMTLREAQTFAQDKFGIMPEVSIFRVRYTHGIISIGDYYGDMTKTSPMFKLYGRFEGENIENITGFCEENRLDGKGAEDMMKHLDGKTGTFVTEPFFLTDASIKFSGGTMYFNGFRMLTIKYT